MDKWSACSSCVSFESHRAAASSFQPAYMSPSVILSDLLFVIFDTVMLIEDSRVACNVILTRSNDLETCPWHGHRVSMKTGASSIIDPSHAAMQDDTPRPSTQSGPTSSCRMLPQSLHFRYESYPSSLLLYRRCNNVCAADDDDYLRYVIYMR